MKFECGIYRDIGIRKTNEDSVLCEIIKVKGQRAGLFAVSDGIGGLSEGENASGYVLEELSKKLYTVIVPLVNMHKGKRRLKRALLDTLYHANEDLREYGSNKGIRLGTTLSLLFVLGRYYIAVNTGDSMIYKCGKNRVTPLLLPDVNPDGSINRCIGSFPFKRPRIQAGYITKKTGFLIATDGFLRKMETSDGFFDPKNMTDSEIIEGRLKKMGTLIRKKGEADNASALYVKVF